MIIYHKHFNKLNDSLDLIIFVVVLERGLALAESSSVLLFLSFGLLQDILWIICMPCTTRTHWNIHILLSWIWLMTHIFFIRIKYIIFMHRIHCVRVCVQRWNIFFVNMYCIYLLHLLCYTKGGQVGWWRSMFKTIVWSLRCTEWPFKTAHFGTMRWLMPTTRPKK